MAKSKWKGLRDTFRRELQKSVKHKQSGAAGGKKSRSTWPYFESLYFLADQMTPREASGNIPVSEEISSHQNTEYYDQPDSPEPVSQIPEDHHLDDVVAVEPSVQSERPVENTKPTTKQYEVNNKQSRPTKRSSNDIQKRMIELEEEKLQFFKQRKVETENIKDYDYHFLMGLLPHFKNVKPERKLYVQLQLQQVIANEISTYSNQHNMSESAVFPNMTSVATTSCSPTPQPTPSPASHHSSSYDASSPFSPTSQHSIQPGTDPTNYNIATYLTNFQM